MAKIRRMAGYSPTASQIPGLRNKPISEDDYQYATEVANQPASTAEEKAIKRQAQQDVKYLEAKNPDLAKPAAPKGTQPNHHVTSSKNNSKPVKQGMTEDEYMNRRSWLIDTAETPEDKAKLAKDLADLKKKYLEGKKK